eukprot:382492_1
MDKKHSYDGDITSDYDPSLQPQQLQNEDISLRESEKFCVYEEQIYEKKENDGRHCKYCPDNKYLLAVHRTFEDETYSALSFAIITYVMILIMVSTISYVIETLP